MEGIALMLGPAGMGISAVAILIYGVPKLCSLFRQYKPWQSDAEARFHEDIIKGQQK